MKRKNKAIILLMSFIILALLIFSFFLFYFTCKHKTFERFLNDEVMSHYLITQDVNILGFSICPTKITIDEKELNNLDLANIFTAKTIVLDTKEIIDARKNVFYHKFEDNVFSNELKLYSLCYLSNLLQAYNETLDIKYLEFVNYYVEQFLSFVDGNFKKITLKSSTDQSFFIRSAVLLDTLKFFNENWLHYEEIIKILNYQKEWLTKEEYFNNNNHGLMSNMALIILNQYFDELNIEKLAMKRTMQMLNDNYTKEGLNDENTPGYQVSNIDLYKGILYLIENNSIYEKEIREIEKKIDLMSKSYSLILWQDNSYPPIGDGGNYLIEGYKSINQSSCFDKGYLAVYKNAEQYTSFVSNFTNIAHKQIDDLSVTLRYNNLDLLIDSGRFSYDEKNVNRMYVESCKGHSSICTSYMDQMQVKEYLNHNIESVKEQCSITKNKMIVKGSLKLDDDILKRKLSIQDKNMIIKDSWLLKNKDKIIIRYKFPQEVVVVSEENRIYKNDNLEFKFVFNSDVRYKISYEEGVYSYLNNQIKNNRSIKIEVEPSLSGEFETEIIILN